MQTHIMDHTLHFLTPLVARPFDNVDAPSRARFLTHRDIPALLELEHEKWNDNQAASQSALRARINTHPDLSLGAFCVRTGRIQASLFMKPVQPDFHQYAKTWEECASAPAAASRHALFGISLSSRNQAGVDALLRFFWPYALHRGYRHIYLGSPIPGLADWLQANPHGRVEDYVSARRSGLPLDPQLRYYHGRGFDRIVALKPAYFPHERSLDHGVLLRGTVPLSSLAPMWRAFPLRIVQRMTKPLAAML
jgi:hypothetical protein